MWGWTIISVNNADQWTTVNLSNPIYIGEAGNFWVGIRKSPDNAVPWQDSDAEPTGINLSTNDRMDPASWTLRDWWYTFMMRTITKTDDILAPKIRTRWDRNIYSHSIQ